MWRTSLYQKEHEKHLYLLPSTTYITKYAPTKKPLANPVMDTTATIVEEEEDVMYVNTHKKKSKNWVKKKTVKNGLLLRRQIRLTLARDCYYISSMEPIVEL